MPNGFTHHDADHNGYKPNHQVGNDRNRGVQRGSQQCGARAIKNSRQQRDRGRRLLARLDPLGASWTHYFSRRVKILADHRLFASRTSVDRDLRSGLPSDGLGALKL
jgi:hypothetical protein